MSTFRTPVGPQPSKVYWRRRLVVLLGLLAVVLVIILIVVRPGSGKPAAAPSNSPSAAATTATAKACKPAIVQVEALVDASSYGAGVEPQLSLAITNTGTTPCTMQAGSDVQEYRVTSGSELIWSSKDCQSAPVPATVTLQPGVPVSAGPIAWDRTRSSAATCSTKGAQVTAKGASYHLSVIVDGIKSPDALTKQFLLN
jgi:hypothetical protein